METLLIATERCRMPNNPSLRDDTAELPDATTNTEPAASAGAVVPTRRGLLRGAGYLALAGGGAAALAACGGDTAPATAPPASSAAPSSPASSAAASPTPAEPSSPASSAAASEAAPKGPSVATAKVPVGGGVVLQDADYVVTQPTKGTYKAFSKICTHQGCPVAAVQNGVIHCECHGSDFSIKDGSVVNPPAQSPLAEAKVTVVGKNVVITG